MSSGMLSYSCSPLLFHRGLTELGLGLRGRAEAWKARGLTLPMTYCPCQAPLLCPYRASVSAASKAGEAEWLVTGTQRGRLAVETKGFAKMPPVTVQFSGD